MQKQKSKRQSVRHIRLTRQVVSDTFDECNALFFNGRIERPVKFETWTPHKRMLGMVRPCYRGKRKGVGSIFHISRRYRWTEENLRRVVVHEMIHLEIEDYKQPLNFFQRLPFIGHLFIKMHNADFVSRMNEINEQYGLDIAVAFPAMKKEFKR
ncbi:MAG: hypothetical protein HDR49_01360 [Bacteroides sp.]|nr:hypothetical protein [Bacteroides sp.]MDE6050299.1 hypothetical protein [Paramuribaculum sp.]